MKEDRPRPSVSIDYREDSAEVRPLIITRVHRPPIARGHRCFILEKREWR